MEWTKELRYKKYSDWDALTLLKLQRQANASKYQMTYHIRPTSGLLNDPNGFSYFNGKYHVFYQSYPFGAVHGLKSWVHLTSSDLVHWKNLGLAINADTKFDSHGAYSGSAHVINDQLFIMYTGNHRDRNWIRKPYQIGATMDKNNQITKISTPLIEPSKHITEHFRDPQLIEDDGTFYTIIGAQDADTKSGKIAIFSSKDLKNWTDLGYLNFTDTEMGYMIECPNLVFVDNQPVLIFCPQGLDKNTANYENIYPNMYLIGSKVNLNKGTFSAEQNIILNLDDGFDVYASQAFNAPNGKAYLISWIGLPDISYPTDSENWANCLSQVKELSIVDGHLYQRPVPAMTTLRKNGIPIRSNKFNDCQQLISNKSSKHYELKLDIEANQTGILHLVANNDLSQSLQIKFSTEKNANLIVDRSTVGINFAEKYGSKRKISLPSNQRLSLDIFVDGSVCEIFINNGYHTMTLRFFAPLDNNKIAFSSKKVLNYTGTYWDMKNI